MPVISEDQWQALAHTVRREVASHFPDWTASNIHDPGITLIELLAFLAESLLYRADRIGAHERRAVAQRLASVANALATTGTAESAVQDDDGLLRVNYFSGQVLGIDDFTAEQDYVREKFRRLNRSLHGVGVVTGLRVSIDHGSGGARVVIEPGLAIDARGEEIEVRQLTWLPLPPQGQALLVQIRYAERLCRPVPTIAGDDDSDAQQYSRIEETFDASLTPTADATAVALARLSYVNKRWVLDRRFKEPRVGR